MQNKERTGRNRLRDIDNLHKASREQLRKSCVIGKIENERETIIDIVVNHLVKK